MGKKKDKAAKSKKHKSGKKQLKDAAAEPVQTSETEAENIEPSGIAAASSPYAERVSTEDVMELVNSLDNNLDQLEKSTQSLQDQIARNQSALQRKLTIFEVVALVLVVGIFSVGYNAAKSSTRATNDVNNATADILNMRAQIDRIGASVDNLSGNMDNFDNKMNAVSANVAGVNKIVNKLATDVEKLDNNNTNQPYDPWGTRRYWR